MARGVLFLVVGPSGVGKDTLIDAARERLAGDPHFVFARRVVTRAAEAGGEDHEAVAPAAFDAMERAGAFAIAWRAHGLAYGIRSDVLGTLHAGANVVVNGSRQVVGAVAERIVPTVVLLVTAPAHLVRARLEARGREDAEAVASRLSRAVALNTGAPVVEIANAGTVATGCEALLAALLSHANRPASTGGRPLHHNPSD